MLCAKEAEGREANQRALDVKSLCFHSQKGLRVAEKLGC